MMRGVGVRDRMRRMKNRLRRSERSIVEVQALVRGRLVRDVFQEHLLHYRESVSWATMVSPYIPRLLTRRFKLV